MEKKGFKRLPVLPFSPMLFGLLSCQNNSSRIGPEKMAAIVSTLKKPWFIFLPEKASENAKALGYETKIFNPQNNMALGTDHFENAIASGYQVVLFNPTDADGSVVCVFTPEASVPVFVGTDKLILPTRLPRKSSPAVRQAVRA